MNSEIEMKHMSGRQPRTPSRFRKRVLSPLVCSIAATIGIFGGISSLIAGLICVVIHSVVSGDRVFDQVGSVLLIIAIPMILIGAVFLDEIDIKK